MNGRQLGRRQQKGGGGEGGTEIAERAKKAEQNGQDTKRGQKEERRGVPAGQIERSLDDVVTAKGWWGRRMLEKRSSGSPGRIQ